MQKHLERQVQCTEDGSKTLYVPEMDEHYHSVKGALTESKHIFIEMGLQHSTAVAPRILEIGFGTGLNAFLTLLNSEHCKREVHYTTLELYPLEMNVLQEMDYPSLISPENSELYYNLHKSAWETDVKLTPYFTLHKCEADYTKNPLNGIFDVIYFDAFAPEKQPEMWSQELFNRLFSHTAEGGILTTYCAKGVVRRMLQAAGYKVERLPGPPGGKREILRATKVADYWAASTTHQDIEYDEMGFPICRM